MYFYFFKKQNKGFSTLEILIAMSIMAICLSAVIMVSFGNQSLLIGSQTNSEAINKTQGLLEKAQADARKDFKLVNPYSVDENVGGLVYHKSVIIEQPDLFTKKVNAIVSWTSEQNLNLDVQLSTLVTNFENAVGGDTCSSVLSGNWQSPQITNLNFANLVSDSAGTYSITDMDAYMGKLYVTTNDSSANKENFFVFNIVNPTNPVLSNKIDNNSAANAGLNSVAVAISSTKSYAYVANGNGANFGTCTNPSGANASCSQLQVIDISTNPPQVKYSLKMPGVTGSGGQAIGQSIFYKDGYIYLGLAKTASGPEFNIIDVHNPLSPSWVGGYSVGNAVNAIFVKGKYVYLTTPNDQELIILDISNPTSPILKGGFNAPDSVGHGKSLYLVGDALYLGRTVTASNPEFYILNNSNPATALSQLGTAQDIGSSINGVIVRDYLAFLITKTQFQVLKIDQTVSPWSISQWATPLSLPATESIVESAFDCESNNFFAGSNDSSNKGYLSIISAL